MNTSYDLFELDSMNPLLQGLPPEQTLMAWADDLKYDPRSQWRRPFRNVAESHAHVIEATFIPTQLSVQAVATLFTAIIVSLRRRDPRIARNRRALFELAENKRKSLGKDLKNLPWFSSSAAGAILMGPTGCTKTHTVKALFRLLPQVIEHGPEPECGWIHLKQLVYLPVEMPGDASRAGLLLGIVKAVDEALGTDYASVILKRHTIEEKLVEVLLILMIHRCGLLVLDEVQVRNVKPLVLGSEFATFFLRILNCGIPLVLIGNPLSFEHVLSFSQDLRRLTSAGIYKFGPVRDARDVEWNKVLVPGVWNWTIFNKPDDEIRGLPKLLFERTGGIPDVLVKYRRECLVEAWRSGSDHVTRRHMNLAWESPTMAGLHKLVEAYVNRDLSLLEEMEDQPIAYLEEFWAAKGSRQKRAAPWAEAM